MYFWHHWESRQFAFWTAFPFTTVVKDNYEICNGGLISLTRLGTIISNLLSVFSITWNFSNIVRVLFLGKNFTFFSKHLVFFSFCHCYFGNQKKLKLVYKKPQIRVRGFSFYNEKIVETSVFHCQVTINQ